ncbi:hypothetical protein [uncultured Brevundimonas sp.]|uniref:hypothetical protein n=1 Tax=uncultured Brevundimonas sp. TaxID=213418 RepID=UPI0030EE91F1|tara:strand:+ start:253771 stop:254202 length:432 start_codon:yes stop_codon:yes gene_type:complete
MSQPFSLVVGIVLLNVSMPVAAFACSPPAFVAPEPSQATVDEVAFRIFQDSDYLAEVIVERSPRFRLRNESGSPPPGRLRVVNVIKGAPPSIIIVMADPCLAYFQTRGERLIVAHSRNYPLTMTERQAASLRRRGLGDWSRIR